MSYFDQNDEEKKKLEQALSQSFQPENENLSWLEKLLSPQGRQNLQSERERGEELKKNKVSPMMQAVTVPEVSELMSSAKEIIETPKQVASNLRLSDNVNKLTAPSLESKRISVPPAKLEDSASQKMDEVVNQAPPAAIKNPMVLEAVAKKVMGDDYSPEKLQEALARAQDRKSGLGWLQFASGFGDAVAGRDTSNTQRAFDNIRKNIDEEEVGAFEKKRKTFVDNRKFEDETIKRQNELALTDPNSAQSVSFRKAIESNFPRIAQAYGDNWNTVSAADQDLIFKPLQLKEQIEARRQIAEQTAAEKALARQIKASEQTDMKQNVAVALGFGKRVEQAEKVFSDLERKGYDRASVASGMGSVFPNVMRSDDALRQEQAERNFVNAVLRRESGAAIAESEFESAEKQYFPRAGDGPETLKQKKENRQQALESLKAEAGKSWDRVPLIGGSSGANSFPRQIRKGNQVATVQSAAELKEARSEGWE